MKKMSFTVTLFLATLIFLVSSCGSNRSFSSRKYTAGNYITHQYKPGKVSIQEATDQEAVQVAKNEAPKGKNSSCKKCTSVYGRIEER